MWHRRLHRDSWRNWGFPVENSARFIRSLGGEDLSNFAVFFVEHLEHHSNHKIRHVFCQRESRSKDVLKIGSWLEYYDPSPLPCVKGKIYRRTGSIYIQLDRAFCVNFPSKQSIFILSHKHWYTPPFFRVKTPFFTMKSAFWMVKPPFILVNPECLVGLNHHFDVAPCHSPAASCGAASVSAWAAVAAAWRATSRRRLGKTKKDEWYQKCWKIPHITYRYMIYVFIYIYI